MNIEDKTVEERLARIKEIASSRPKAPKRFYKQVTIQKSDGDFSVCLDGRVAKTPKRNGLIVPSMALAEALAEEWDAQVDEINGSTMPLTQLANTTIDGVIETVDAVLDKLEDYAQSDLLCYRVAYPESLAEKQFESWQPVLDWVEKEIGAFMSVTTDIVPVRQLPQSLKAIRNAFAKYGPWQLTAAYSLAGNYKSVSLALAVMEGQMSAKDAHIATTLDEDFQSVIWGEDAEAKMRSDKFAEEAIAAERFAHLLRG